MGHYETIKEELDSGNNQLDTQELKSLSEALVAVSEKLNQSLNEEFDSAAAFKICELAAVLSNHLQRDEIVEDANEAVELIKYPFAVKSRTAGLHLSAFTKNPIEEGFIETLYSTFETLPEAVAYINQEGLVGEADAVRVDWEKEIYHIAYMIE